MQLALGASRWRVARQCLVETLLVGISGGVLGMLVARVGVRALVALAPASELPRAGEDPNRRGRPDVFAHRVVCSRALLFGVIPALASASVDVREALLGSSRGTTAGGRRVRGALVSS